MLLVEGREDVRVLPELLEANGVDWGPKGQEVVRIEPHGGIDLLLKPGVIETHLKASRVEAVGVLVDADDEPQSRWEAVRNCCLKSFAMLPRELPATGLVVTNDRGIRFGLWIMPDNGSQGMLETFLAGLLPASSPSPLWELSLSVLAEAKAQGAPFKDAHVDKARIHTWLAWQDPPGRPLHNAIIETILDPRSPTAAPFVAWFRELFAV